MSRVLGARKNGSFKAVSTAPSINKTPMGNAIPPIPYPTMQDLSNSVGVNATVRFNGKPAYVLSQSTQPAGKGDAPGSARGIRSNTTTGQVKPTSASSTVHIGGKDAVRAQDRNTMNGGNNPGIYVVVPAVAATLALNAARTSNAPAQPQTEAETGLMDWARDKLKGLAQNYQDNISESLHTFAGDAMDTGGTIATVGEATVAVGGGVALTGVGAPAGAAIATAGGATTAIGGGVAGVGSVTESAATAADSMASWILTGRSPDLMRTATGLLERMVINRIEGFGRFLPGRRRSTASAGTNAQRSQASSTTQPARSQTQTQTQQRQAQGQRNGGSQNGGGGNDGLRVQGPGGNDDCGIKPYKDQRCPEGQQAHHIVPDYTLRYGSRGKGAKGQDRIPGMPSLQDGPSICLSGQAKVGGTEHNDAHEGTDPRITAAGDREDNGPKGLAPIGEILDISVEEVSRVKPHCEEEIRRKVGDAFSGVDRNKLARATQQPPKKGSDTHAALERGDRHTATNNGTARPSGGRRTR